MKEIKIQLKLFEPADYPALVEWFVHKQVNPPPLERLPALGYVALDAEAGLRLACCFAYLSAAEEQPDGKLRGPGVAFFHHLAANPVNGEEVSRPAIFTVLEQLEARVKELGYSQVITMTGRRGIAIAAEELGYSSEAGYYQLSKYL